MAAVPGLGGVMLTFDEFVGGVESFGSRIPPPPCRTLGDGRMMRAAIAHPAQPFAGSRQPSS